MLGFLVKLIVCPVTVIIAWMLFPNVDFFYWFQPVIIGVILAVASHLMELILLNENTVGFSTFMDLIASIIIVYYASMLQTNSEVTFLGAIFTGALLGVTEIIQHRWLVEKNRTQKNPTTNKV
ncbi:DUF2512 family protein [Aquibacillus rhizosphaerae]|uniref:DUF2512 family protein n=1 Tax=Aquibacillus rhizosphaerae TaxID=3051431 RepID=A0ABT7L5M5_9BACI|nr:DUF2512 family protein [Aquibacillus sp. LR5S19]MDL4841155.1 DUF2512 family protein [Aquibacillus sp. LR5S19]